MLNHFCRYGIADDVSESELPVVCEFVTLCILFFVNKCILKLYEHEFNYEKDTKTIGEVLRLSSKAVRLKYSLVQIPVHVCSIHCPS